MKKFLLLVMVLAALSVSAKTDEAKMNKFIDNLMSKMTLQEKLGQLNLPVSGEIVTGSAKSSNVAEKIKKGQVGGLFNLKGVDKIREVQELSLIHI